jgi:chromosome segregation ATPase
LERLKLQLDGAHTKINDLERSNDELKRSNDQLRRQIDEWQHLERREGEEVDSERKRRVALSVELEKLQAQHKVEVDKLEASLERERQKVQKWKDALDQWQVRRICSQPFMVL